MKPTSLCPCGKTDYAQCCAPIHAGQSAASAETLMRSRYSAYVLRKADYLLASWHSSTRPTDLSLEDDPCQWLGLQIRHHQQHDVDHAEVEFVARYRINGRAYRLHENSRFEREAGHWRYVDGDIFNK